MSEYIRDGLCFRYREAGQGMPVVFQHGLGGDSRQPLAVYRPSPGIRLLSFDFRAHGQTRPLSVPERLTIRAFADDLVAFLDHLGIGQTVIGGISLGAAVGVNAALRYPGRVAGLVLSRPAWIEGPLARNVHLYSLIARLIRQFGPKEGLKRFRTTSEFHATERESPDCAFSLIGQFEQPWAEACVARLERLAADTPCSHRDEYAKIQVPTLILGNRRDPIHPWTVAATLAELIPAADLREITPKSVSVERHAAEVSLAINRFLTMHFLKSNTPC